jgi:hypothetical protein
VFSIWSNTVSRFMERLFLFSDFQQFGTPVHGMHRPCLGWSFREQSLNAVWNKLLSIHLDGRKF